MRFMEELARKDTVLHRLNPSIKLLTTIIYIIAVVSFGRYDITGIFPFFFYPVVVFALAELPVVPILKRILLVEPFVIGIGIINIFFDNTMVTISGVTLSRGWLSLASIFLKCGLTVLASILLVATTGMDKLSEALRRFKIPKVFVLQLLLTYRYITILLEEVSRMLRAYALRAPGQDGIHRKAWGSFAGQLILRTYDRAQRVYVAMSLRGFTGEYNTGEVEKTTAKDYGYLLGWTLFFIFVRIFNIPVLLEMLLLGVSSK
jgi:cobalt/nickel transport system permease protein